ncbi:MULTISPECIES: tripartite tricarboxylate transporter TctB family protein [Allobacillus]|uniref:tripartite tricarboxylate transporter TctB family protein n=1 Tax=Allobacillus TaxID=1400133 RepID=UPI00164344D2|nr:tripartite tricarboxylate transporter TctB family protein [Allobacillus salarius]
MGELIVALALVVLSFLIYTQSGDLPSMNESQLDAGSFPQFVAILLGGLSLILAIKQTIVLIKARKQNSETSIKQQLLYIVKEHQLVFITLALLFIYILAIQLIGFILSSILFIIVTAMVIGPRMKKSIVTVSSIAIILTISLYFFFQSVLQVRFPTGVFF